MRCVLVRSLAILAAAFAAGAGAGTAKGVGTDVGGDWCLRIQGEKGTLVLHVPGSPQFGVFEAHGAGYTTLFPAQPFALAEEPVQTLAYDSSGDVHGVLTLDDVTRTTSIGQLTVLHGGLDATAARMTLRGTMTLGDPSVVRRVTLTGPRLTDPTVPLTGRTFDGVLAGRRVHSTKYDVQLYQENQTAAIGVTPALNERYPFFYLRAGGAARIDGTEVPDSRVEGLLVADARGLVCGRVTSSDFGPAVLRGRFVTNDPSTLGLPIFSAQIVADSGRRMHLIGVLQPFGN
jgi:hypothetical protein